MDKPVIGILVWRKNTKFHEPVYFRDLVREGLKLGAETFVFSYFDIDQEKRTVRGFVPTATGGWESRSFPWPDVVINRFRVGGAGYKEVRDSSMFLFANNKFNNKWPVTQLFLGEPKLARWMPETVEFSGENLTMMLKKHKMLYVKPGNGTAGLGIVKIMRSRDGFQIWGRRKNYDKAIVSFTRVASLLAWMNGWTETERLHRGNFMIQQGLDLALIPQRVVDTRLLIQKDEHGKWEVTGLGIRVGGPNSATSNLHGGGMAAPFEPIIERKFGRVKAAKIKEQCHELAHQVVQTIEEHFGSMMEFGIDIGIDVNGDVWLIEANPKPGREIFKRIGQTEVYRKAVRRPIQYAMYLAAQSDRTVKTKPEMKSEAEAKAGAKAKAEVKAKAKAGEKAEVMAKVIAEVIADLLEESDKNDGTVADFMISDDTD